MTTPDHDPMKLMPLTAAARMVGVRRRLLYDAIRRGEGPPIVQIGGRAYVRAGALLNWLGTREHTHVGVLRPRQGAAQP